MCKIIVISNQKGGVGKTTTASALIGGLSNRGFKVLGIDFDPQGNLSSSFGINKNINVTITDVLTNNIEIDKAIIKKGKFDFLPANINLSIAEREISEVGREYRLKEKIEPIKDNYDFIIIDTPPSLGFLTINAFTTSDYLIITSTPSNFSLDGIIELNKTIEQTKKYCNDSIEILGILVTRLRKNTRVGKDMLELTSKIGAHLNADVFDTTIREAIAVEEAILSDINIVDFIDTPVADDYNNFIDELLETKNIMVRKDKQ